MVKIYRDEVRNTVIIDCGTKTIEIDVLGEDKIDIAFAVESSVVRKLLEGAVLNG